MSKKQETVAIVVASEDIKNFFIHLTHFQFQRQSWVKKIDLAKHGGLTNFRGFIMMQGIAKFRAMV